MKDTMHKHPPPVSSGLPPLSRSLALPPHAKLFWFRQLSGLGPSTLLTVYRRWVWGDAKTVMEDRRSSLHCTASSSGHGSQRDRSQSSRKSHCFVMSFSCLSCIERPPKIRGRHLSKSLQEASISNRSSLQCSPKLGMDT